jgi:hypothetical protein
VEPDAAAVTFLPTEKGTWRCELDYAVGIRPREIRIEPPSEVRMEFLGAIDVGNRDDGDLELHVDRWCCLHF